MRRPRCQFLGRVMSLFGEIIISPGKLVKRRVSVRVKPMTVNATEPSYAEAQSIFSPQYEQVRTVVRTKDTVIMKSSHQTETLV
jgi:hypothetical protein